MQGRRLAWLQNNGYINDSVIQHTKTTKFLMPLIGLTETFLEGKHKDLLINAYYIKEEPTIVVVLNNVKYNGDKEFLVAQNFNENFDKLIEETDEYLLYFNLPKHFHDDFSKILEGKYSKTSNEYKEIITRIYGVGRNTSNHKPTVYDALFPTDGKRMKMADYFGIDDYTTIDEVAGVMNHKYEEYCNVNNLNQLTFI